MKEYDVVLTRRAKNDIIDIGDYISYTLLEPETAYRFVTGLRGAISPEIEETMNTVIVLRVGYNRRNWKEILLKK